MPNLARSTRTKMALAVAVMVSPQRISALTSVRRLSSFLGNGTYRDDLS